MALVTTVVGFRNMRQLCCFHVFIPLCLFKLEMGYGFALSQGEKQQWNQPTTHSLIGSLFLFSHFWIASLSSGIPFFFLFFFPFSYGARKGWGLICLYNLNAQHVEPLQKKRHPFNICPINGYWKAQIFMADERGRGSCLLTGKTLFIRSVWLVWKVCSWISFMVKEENQYQMVN